MKNVILTPENIEEVTRQLNEISKDKKYWLGIEYGKSESIEDDKLDIFRGVGTFERIAYLQFGVWGHCIKITHLSATDSFGLTPQESYFRIGAEISVDGSDILSFENDPQIGKDGGTQVYVEWTVERNEKYKPALV